ncbi:MAG: RAMP superfamily CRISPR-associated protein, partial [Candidatus Adiutrix sp.]|nr:RAMP superfamily CRISPR-associated protein [Candidatus Adiutrix sp.]
MIYLARFIVKLITPLHCGAGGGDDFDQPVDRDSRGLYRLPGSSVAGILRARAGQSFSETAVKRAFGSITQGQNEGTASAIWCHDGRLLDFDDSLADERTSIPLGPFIRDHVRIDFKTGAAQRGGKFDEEYVPA